MRLRLLAEFLLLYAAVPLSFYFRVLPNLPIPTLLATAAVVWILLRRDPKFDRRRLWNRRAQPLRRVLLRALAIAASLALAVALWRPELLFSFPRRAPAVWGAVMLLYPVLSVYPQELVWRAFLFHRYQPLFGSGRGATAASAAAFGFAHIVFGHWISVGLSAAGGLLFASTYARTRSLAAAALEHAILGDAVFTAGLGRFFYHAAAAGL